MFHEIGFGDIASVGGKNASLGEMTRRLAGKGIAVPGGFAINTRAYWKLVTDSGIRPRLEEALQKLDTTNYTNLHEVGEECRKLILSAPIPREVQAEVLEYFGRLKATYAPGDIRVAVRSSATAEDLAEASFAGQLESYLNIQTEEELIDACHHCYASLFTDRVIKYRNDHGFAHMEVGLSIGVQKMVRSDLACAGVAFTLDPETGFDRVVMISGSWGLGENVVKGNVTPDEFYVFKTTLANGHRAVINRRMGAKERTMTLVEKGSGFETKTINRETPPEKQMAFVLSDKEAEALARWAVVIEETYGRPVDIEWAKDGADGQLYIVQARPETVYANKEGYHFYSYKLLEKGKVLTEGNNVGNRIASGKARILASPREINKLRQGEVLVTGITNPDWDPVLRKASAIVTDHGGNTSHAAIVARETGAVAVVGTGNATRVIRDGQEVTVSCATGRTGVVYEGLLPWEKTEIDTRDIHMPQTDIMLILADPDQAFRLAQLPNKGVGLLRLEFAISNTIRIHPMALAHFDRVRDEETRRQIETLTQGYQGREAYFVERLSEAVATIAAAFYPQDVIVRLSDFKTNEYANLIGGNEFEPTEENPMLGWRGASRYYSDGYRDGFRLECEAMKRVREEMGLGNVKLMIPFCRTVDEGKKVLGEMEKNGLKRHENGLEVYVMVEVPSNVIMAEEFAAIFDGFSIGSNDLTQLILGIERDSDILSPLFDPRNEAVKRSIKQVIDSAIKTGTRIGLCGQAPSDYPEFAQFLVQCGISSISFNPDALIKGIENVHQAENRYLIASETLPRT